MLARGDTVRTSSLEITSLSRNAFPPSPVALRLPVELLQKIFLLMVDLYPPGPSRRPVWIAITYVCHYWRSAALGLRELWTRITPSLSISWSQAMMERSAPLPMNIGRLISAPLANGAEAFTASLAEASFATAALTTAFVDASFADGVNALAASGLLSASRIRTLRLLGRPTDILEVLSCLSSPSPLESLSLFVVRTGEPVDLPETMCERHTPHFRRLTYETGTRIRAPLWLLASVTHFITHANAPLNELLGTLQAMPQLEMLRLAYTFYERDYIDSANQLSLPSAVLPHLSHLSVCELSPHFLLILSSRIDAPPVLRRHLFWRIFPIRGWEPNIFTAMQALVPRDSAPGMDDGGLRVAQVAGGPARGLFEAWSRSGAGTAAFTREGALFLFQIDWVDTGFGRIGDKSPFFHLASLCAHLRTTRIEDLTVAREPSSAIKQGTATDEQDTPDVPAQWQALLAALPSVKTLRLHRGNPECVSVLRALAESPGLLPHLKKVFVVRSTVRYAAGSTTLGGGIGVADADAGSAMADHNLVQENVGVELVEAVSVRSGLEVMLVGCEVDEEALEALRKRARVDFGKEWEYMQSVHVTLK